MADAPDSTFQKTSPSYRLPALDETFLLGESMRGVRFMLEYSKADEILNAWNIHSTIVVFGSARAKPDDEGERGRWYRTAREFGRIASTRGGALDGNRHARQNVIATGGGPGIMEAANRGAHEAGAPSIGFNITLPEEQDPNPYSTPELTFRFHYFAMRKMHLAMRANALVIFPGGFGTLDEMFEILTLRQTRKMPEIPIVVVDRAYWTAVINFDVLAEHGTINREDLDLFAFADTAERAWEIIAAAGVTSDDD
ncbi:MAG: TIGR00730 family Rossman fold protein [Hyphomicrobiales bacterium]